MPKESKTINIVTIGHVDHGKSTLIGRMLYDSGSISPARLKDAEDSGKKIGKEKIDFAFLMDTFQEEREDGITIDIMHTPFRGKKNKYMFIDCPGHREFIKNMITGASHADAALLLVSAKKDEGIENQTKEHLWLAKILGINQIIVVINKMDTADYGRGIYDSISKEMRNLLKSIGYDYEKIPFVPVSAIGGDNVYKKSEKMKWYDGPPLIDVMDNKIKPTIEPVDMPLRIVIQDVYDVGGKKIVVGRIESGILKVGDMLVLKPSDIVLKLSSIRIIDREVDGSEAGESIGMVLEGDVGSIKRGDVASHKENVTNVAQRFTTKVYIMQPLEMREGGVVDLRCGTASVDCNIKKIINVINPRSGAVLDEEKDIISQGEAATIEFVSKVPIAIEKHSEIEQLGRFVILHDGLTKAYGIVVDTK